MDDNQQGKANQNSLEEKKDQSVPQAQAGAGQGDQVAPVKLKKEVVKKGAQKVVRKGAGRGRVLMIEDDPPMVKMYSTKLEIEGFEVEVAYDGEEGLKKIEQWKPDLVVLDLMIPKVGGMDVLEKLRLVSATKNVPVMILSNLSQEQDIQRAKELGVKEFLVKANYTPGQVVEKIRQTLAK
ncbi:response regulator transcription factor [Patescibacteria group bacterium]